MSTSEEKREVAAAFRGEVEKEEDDAAGRRDVLYENAYRRGYKNTNSKIAAMMDSFKKGEVDLEKAQEYISVLISDLAVMIIKPINKKFAKLDDRVAFIQKMRTFKTENEKLWSGEKKIIAQSVGKVLGAFRHHGITGTGGKRKTRKRRKSGGKKTRRVKSRRRKSRRRKRRRKKKHRTGIHMKRKTHKHKKKHRRKTKRKRRVKRRRKTTRKKRGRGLGPSKMAKLGVAALATSTAMGQGMGYGISPSMGTAAAVEHFNTVPCAEFHISDLPPHHTDHGASNEHAAAVTKAALRKKRSCKRRGKPMRNPNTGKPMSKNEAKKAQKRIRAQEKAAKEAAEQAKAAKAAKAEQAAKREEALLKKQWQKFMEESKKKIEKIEKKEEADKLAAKLEEQAEKTKTSKAKAESGQEKAAKAEAEQAKAAKAEAEQSINRFFKPSEAAKAEAEQQQEIEEEVVREMESERNEGSKGMGGAEMAAYGAAATAAGLATHEMLRGRRRARTTRIVRRGDGSRFVERINDGRNVRELTPERRRR